MNKLLTSLVCALLFTSGSHAQNKFTLLPSMTYASAVSPGGRYIIGNDLSNVYGISGASFVYDTQADTISWRTSFDGTDFSKCGQLRTITDNGVMCGVTKDMGHITNFLQEPAPTNIATVWEDGRMTQLPYGDLDTTLIKQQEDGTFACDMTADGKTVVGYLASGNFAETYPCKWVKGNDGIWTLQHFNLPDGYTTGTADLVSADGSLILGSVIKNWDTTLCYWLNGEYHALTLSDADQELANRGSSFMVGVSPNGRYVLFSLCNRVYYRIYDMQTGTYREIPSFDNEGVLGNVSITNKGDVFGTESYGSIFFGTEVYNHPFWYQYSSNRLFDLTYYLKLFAPGVNQPFSLSYTDKTQAFPVAVSADGNTVVGNKDIYTMLGETPNAWYVQAQMRDVVIPATPASPSAVSNALHTVDLSWPADTSSYASFTLKGYNVYCNGKLSQALTQLSNPMQLTLQNVEAGYPQFTVEGVYQDANGQEMTSPVSNPATVAVPDNYNMPMFDDFEGGSLQTNYWQSVKYQGDDNDGYWTAAQYMGYQSSYGVTTGATMGTPYSNAIVSRPIDAKTAKAVKCTFMAMAQPFSTAAVESDKDTLSVDYSLDNGTSWTTAKAWTVALLPKQWGYLTVNLTQQLAGKQFRLRIHKHGLGKLQYYIYLDNVSISADATAAAMTGMTGHQTAGNQVALAWKDPQGAYALNYVHDPALTRYTLGNAGKELIGANKFTTRELALYHGKYINSVSTILNYYNYYPDTLGIHATAVVYQDGQLVREKEFDNVVYNGASTATFDEPLQIDSTRELMVGVKIHDYDSWQIPLLYDVSDACVPGKSDLFSEDGGQTWQSTYDYYHAQGDEYRSKCVWQITANVTDEANATIGAADDNLVGYNVFRNGQVINSAYLPANATHFTDSIPEAQSDYYVVAYYADGSESAPSNVYSISLTSGIGSIAAQGALAQITGSNVTLKNGGRLTLYTVGGEKARMGNGSMSLAGLHPGVYVLTIEQNGQRYTQKIMIQHPAF